MDNIFVKIINREIPAAIFYEDDTVICFLDIRPINKGHALVVSKEHFRNIFDAPEAALAHMIVVAQKVARAVRASVNADGVNIIMNNEPAAGQEIFHAHLHVIPRFQKDEAFQPTHHEIYDIDEIDELAEKMKAAIA